MSFDYKSYTSNTVEIKLARHLFRRYFLFGFNHFFLEFSSSSFSYISDKKLVSIRIKATDYFLKIFRSHLCSGEFVNLAQSPFSSYR